MAPTREKQAARRRRTIVRILDEIERVPSLREMTRRLAKRGIRTTPPTVAKDLDALAAEGRIPFRATRRPPASPDAGPQLQQQVVAEATYDAAHQSLVHALMCLDLYARLKPEAAASTGRARGQVHRAIHQLVAAPPPPVAVDLEAALDCLVATPDWEYPTSVLERPHPDLGELLAVCRARLEKTSDESERRGLAEVEAKLARAVRIAESARRRRWQRAVAAFLGVEPPPDDEG